MSPCAALSIPKTTGKRKPDKIGQISLEYRGPGVPADPAQRRTTGPCGEDCRAVARSRASLQGAPRRTSKETSPPQPVAAPVGRAPEPAEQGNPAGRHRGGSVLAAVRPEGVAGGDQLDANGVPSPREHGPPPGRQIGVLAETQGASPRHANGHIGLSSPARPSLVIRSTWSATGHPAIIGGSLAHRPRRRHLESRGPPDRPPSGPTGCLEARGP